MGESVRRRFVCMLSVMILSAVILCTGIGGGLLVLTADAANKTTEKGKAAVTGVRRTATTDLTGVPAAWRLKQGKKLTLNVGKIPAASKDKITYASSKKSVATITSRGKITARKPGTTVITVKAGRCVKKFTLTVINEKRSPEEFLNICEDTARQIALDGRWCWWYSGMSKNWKDAQKNRKTSCAHFVSMCMQRAGLLPSGCVIYCRKDGKLIFQSPKAKTKKALFKYFRYISCQRPLDKCDLRPGDVLGIYDGKTQHMTVFAGYDAAGQTLWYDFGSDGTTDPTKILASGTFRTCGTFNRIQKVGGNDWGKVSFILRLR